MTTTTTTSFEGPRALEELLPQLATLEEDAIVRPHTDPHAAAVTALLVADWLTQPVLAERLGQVGLEPQAPRELARVARAIIAIIETLGGDYLSDVKEIPHEIAARGQAVRLSTIKELEKALPYDRDVTTWLEAVKMGSGVVDLVYDLRTLAELLTRHSDSIKDSLARLPALLRASSDALEYALRADEPPELALARGRLARLWTLFVPAYEQAATAGRVLTREQGAERSFPPLALVAAHRRARRRPVSAAPPPPPPPMVLENEASRSETTADPTAITVKTKVATATTSADTETTGKNEAAVAAAVAAAAALRDSGRHARETGSRKAYRAVLELEVGIESESNFYVGFTENVSSAGIFVATYLLRPIGARMEIEITLPDGQTMRIPGEVRWQRAASEDGWPGMGVRFDSLSKEQDARIQRFIALREPMFYVE